MMGTLSLKPAASASYVSRDCQRALFLVNISLNIRTQKDIVPRMHNWNVSGKRESNLRF